jgi:glycosyltransferase involved in cell wall biosynthesis
MARLHGGRAVWGLRQSERDPLQYGWLTRWGERAGAWFSRSADLIIANSFAGKRHYAAHGYRADRMVVVHNGVDTARFRRDRAAGREMRREWEIADDDLLVGMIGRLDPQKDHPTFLRAAAVVAKQRPNVRFVCVGSGPAAYAKELRQKSDAAGLNGRVLWTPSSNNVLGIYNALDLATLSSKNGEGFANVVGEAMACGIPVVVTDAGDSAFIVGDKEHVVPTRQPEALAQAWLRMLDLPAGERDRIGAAQRIRIEENFQVSDLLKNTLAALEGIR